MINIPDLHPQGEAGLLVETTAGTLQRPGRYLPTLFKENDSEKLYHDGGPRGRGSRHAGWTQLCR